MTVRKAANRGAAPDEPDPLDLLGGLPLLPRPGVPGDGHLGLQGPDGPFPRHRVGRHLLDDHGGRQPVDSHKQIYGQVFAIYALSEYYRATGEKPALDEAHCDLQPSGGARARTTSSAATTTRWTGIGAGWAAGERNLLGDAPKSQTRTSTSWRATRSSCASGTTPASWRTSAS